MCGGYEGENCLATVECYNPENDQWTDIAPMSNRRKGAATVAYHGEIYVLGGFSGVTRLTSGEKYNPYAVKSGWRAVKDMHDCRSNMACEVRHAQCQCVMHERHNVLTSDISHV